VCQRSASPGKFGREPDGLCRQVADCENIASRVTVTTKEMPRNQHAVRADFTLAARHCPLRVWNPAR
jgi:hypothetical protein